ncbi:hypothetical protein [Sphingosinicella soli]|uniref:EF-hand domain-containing protein n=1 Tax=Sphingosinicella soli TaxID=333708 RepID=A0A7W7F877_9SPHN|nr:hypothetical protein [Sphingosinicella soli]MBB4631343.1 hypothetical protein [Sphingosinicella soli]
MRVQKTGLMAGTLVAALLALPAAAQDRDRERPQRERGMQVNRDAPRAPEARQRVPEARPQTTPPQQRVAPPERRPEARIERPQPNTSRMETRQRTEAVQQRMNGVIGRDNPRGDNNRGDWDKNRDRSDNRNWDRNRDRDRNDDWRDRDRDRDRDRWRDNNRRPVVIVRPSPTYHYRPHWWGSNSFYFDNRYHGHYDYNSWYRPGYGFYGSQYGSGWATLDPWLRQDPAAKHWVMWNFDRNRNGQLSKDEARTANREFARLADRNRRLNDGEIRFGVEELRDEYRYSFNR